MTEGMPPEMLEIIVLCAPGDELRLGEAINTEGAWRLRRWLIGVGRYYFEIRRWAQCQQGVARSASRVLTSRSCSHAREPFNLINTPVQIGRGIDQVINP